MIYAAIVAGGTGSRMGADIPKQFLPLGGKPVLIRTIERFLECDKIDRVFIGVHPDWTDKLAEMCAEDGLEPGRIRIVSGGKDRNGTVFGIVDSIINEYGISDSDIIVTHDGVRPFVTVKEIEDSIAAMERFEGVTVCDPVKDTILCSEDGETIKSVPKRQDLFRTLTPQTFRLSVLLDCFDDLTPLELAELTDTAGVLRTCGRPVGLVTGGEYNIKLTTPVDMSLAEILLGQEEKETPQRELLRLILNRRSYRGKYSPEPVPRETLAEIMRAGLAAPSGCNKQTTSLIAVDDRDILARIRAVIDPPVGETAPAAIFVLTQRIAAYRDRCFAVQDYSAAIENMLLAIEAFGLRSCWYEGHITDKDNIGRKIADILNVPREYELVCFLPVGKPLGEPSQPNKMPFDSRAWFNGFGKTV